MATLQFCKQTEVGNWRGKKIHPIGVVADLEEAYKSSPQDIRRKYMTTNKHNKHNKHRLNITNGCLLCHKTDFNSSKSNISAGLYRVVVISVDCMDLVLFSNLKFRNLLITDSLYIRKLFRMNISSIALKKANIRSLDHLFAVQS